MRYDIPKVHFVSLYLKLAQTERSWKRMLVFWFGKKHLIDMKVMHYFLNHAGANWVPEKQFIQLYNKIYTNADAIQIEF